MSAWIVWLAMVAALSGALVWGMRREFDRLEREARVKALLAPIVKAWREMQIAIGTALMPAMREMAAYIREAEPVLRRLGEQMATHPDPGRDPGQGEGGGEG